MQSLAPFSQAGEGAAAGTVGRRAAEAGARGVRRGDYTFNRKYTHSRVRQLPNCEGLRSIDVYENQGMARPLKP